MWLGPYVVLKVLKKGTYELIDFDGKKLSEPRNGLYLKSTMLRLSAFSCILLHVFLCTLVRRFVFFIPSAGCFRCLPRGS